MFSVIFEVRPGDGRKDAYLEHARLLRPELEGIDGFIDNERFLSRTRPGWVLSHSTWRDEKSVVRWRTHAGHHLTQSKGRTEVFSDYHLRVGEVTADSHPPAGHPVREQRFDATEVGAATVCTLVEMMPGTTALPSDAEGLLPALGIDPRANGLVAWDAFDSFTNPGKALALLSWTDEGAASGPASTADIRNRTVRVIRDYGMFDRRESPQFFPAVPVPRGVGALG